ncbi:MAG: NAD(P)-dependent oxidoreductase, partial [Thiohalorhabdaceae bacterium]
MAYLPLFHDLHGQPVLVVGGGEVGARKVAMLRKAGARVTVVAPELTDELAPLAADGTIAHKARRFRAENPEYYERHDFDLDLDETAALPA